MKKLYLILLIWVACPFFSRGQCSISVCDKTGAFAYAYNDDNEYYSMKELKEMSLRECRKVGGTACFNYHESYKAGWWSFMSGYDDEGVIYYSGSEGNSSKEDAIDGARRKYKEMTGTYGYDFKVYTWYVYSH